MKFLSSVSFSLISFHLKFIFSDIRIGTSFYFLVPFIWSLFPGLIWLEFCPLFPLGQCLFLKLGCVSCRLQIDFFLDSFIESMSFDWRTEAIDISRYYWNVHVNWDHYIVDFCFFFVYSVVFCLINKFGLVFLSAVFLLCSFLTLAWNIISCFFFFRIILLDIIGFRIVLSWKIFLSLQIQHIVLLGLLSQSFRTWKTLLQTPLAFKVSLKLTIILMIFLYMSLLVRFSWPCQLL